jgi:light-regulated signal transduction histidine kinase (bacteriophytochrome)
VERTAQLESLNRELESFSYSISHDLRAPLRGIVGFTTILEEDYGNKFDDEARRITSIIKNNTLRMGHLIDDLLTFSRMGRQDIVKTNITTSAMIHDVIEDIVPAEKKDRIEWMVHDVPDVKGDINAMRQVWINLVSNAVKYSGNREHPKIEIGSFSENNHTTFFVKDNGVGFDEKYKEKLFKVFQRLHGADEFEGTGVGLAIVEKIVGKHGGKVFAEGRVNEGATFYFELPNN